MSAVVAGMGGLASRGPGRAEVLESSLDALDLESYRPATREMQRHEAAGLGRRLERQRQQR